MFLGGEMIVETYCSSSGTYYVQETLAKLPPKAVKKIVGRLKLLRQYGVNFLTHSGTMKKLQGYDLYEIVVDFNKVFYRIFCVIRQATCWLLHLFAKKSNDTPLREIKTALQRAKDLDVRLALVIS